MPHFDLENIIRTVGYFGVWAIIFAETGLFRRLFAGRQSALHSRRAGKPGLFQHRRSRHWLLLPPC